MFLDMTGKRSILMEYALLIFGIYKTCGILRKKTTVTNRTVINLANVDDASDYAFPFPFFGSNKKESTTHRVQHLAWRTLLILTYITNATYS